MAKIQFNLAAQGLDTGKEVPLSAPMAQGGGPIQAPSLRAPMQEAATLPFAGKSVPTIDPGVFEHGSNQLIHAALSFQERQDTYNAEDALLKAREKSRNLFWKTNADDSGPIGFEQLSGKDAMVQSKDYQSAITAAYDGPAAELNGNARAKYLAAAQQHKFSDLDRLARHAVKQQTVYAGQVDYANQDAFKREFELDPMGAMSGGAFNRLVAGQPDLESQNKVKDEVFSFATNKFIAEDFREGHKTAAGFLQLYGGMASPDARLKAEEKIATASKAALAIAQREADDTMYKRQMQFTQTAPVAVSEALRNGNGGAITDIHGQGAELIKPKTYKEFVDSFSDIVTQGMQLRFNKEETDPEQLRQEWVTARNNAQAAGKPIPQGVDYKVAEKIQEIDHQRQVLQGRRDQDGLRFLMSNATQDPVSGEMQYDFSKPLPGKSSLNPEVLNTLKTKDFKNQLAVQDIRDAKAYENNFHQWYALAVSGKLAEGSPEENQFLMAQTDQGTRLKFSDFKAIQSLYQSGGDDKLGKNPEHKAAYEYIDVLKTRGQLSTEMSNRAGKTPYKASQQDLASLTAEGAWKMKVDTWMQANPGKPVMPELQRWLAQSAISGGGIKGLFGMGDPDYTVPKAEQQTVPTAPVVKPPAPTNKPPKKKSYEDAQ